MPSAGQREDFRKLGFFHLGRIFGQEELDEIRREYDRCLARPMRVGHPDGDSFDYSPLLQLQSPVLCAYAASPRLAEVALGLLGSDIRLYWDQAVSKPARTETEVPWHQDNGYVPVVPHEYLTFTVALDATTVENGCLWIQPGSHHEGVQPHEKTDAFFYRGYAGDETGVPVEQPEGDVLCFSSLTMHRTGPNRSDGPRRSWVIQLCPADARHGESGRPFDDRLLIARDGKPLVPPIRERDFDLQALIASRS